MAPPSPRLDCRFVINSEVGKRVVLKKIDTLVCRLEESVTAIGYIIMTLAVIWSVFCRYVLKIPFLYGDEAARYIMIICVFIGVSIGTRKGAHLGIEAFVGMLPENMRRKVTFVAGFFTMVLFFVLAWATLTLTITVYGTEQHTSSLYLPMWVVYVSLPIGMCLSGIREIQILVLMLQRPVRYKRAA